MTDFQSLLNRTRDQIMDREPSFGDVVRAGVQSTTGVPYAQALQARTNADMQQLLQQYGVLSAERGFKSAQEQQAWERGQAEREFTAGRSDEMFRRGHTTRVFDANQAQQIWERAQAEQARGDRNFAVLLELASSYGANPADAQQVAANVVARVETEDMNDLTALPSLVAEEAANLDIPPKIGAAGQIVGAGSTYGKVNPVTGEFEPEYMGPPAGPSTIIADVGEREYEKRSGQALLDAQVKAQETLSTADSLESTTSQLKNVLERAETGTLRGALGAVAALGEDMGVDVPAVASRLGINIDAPADSQTIQRLSAGLILERMSTLPDARPSDRDLAMIERASAGLLRTREDNLRYIAAIENSIERMRGVAEIARTSTGWTEYQDNMAKWRAENPIVTYTGPRAIIMSDGRKGYYDDDLGWYRYEDTNEEMPR